MSDVETLKTVVAKVDQSGTAANRRTSDLLQRLQDSSRKCAELAGTLQRTQADHDMLKLQHAAAAEAAKERETELLLKLANSTRSAGDAAHRRESELLEQLADSERKAADNLKASQAQIDKLSEAAMEREADLLSQIAAIRAGLEAAEGNHKTKIDAASKEQLNARDALDRATRSATLLEGALEKVSGDLAEARREITEMGKRLVKANAAGTELLGDCDEYGATPKLGRDSQRASSSGGGASTTDRRTSLSGGRASNTDRTSNTDRHASSSGSRTSKPGVRFESEDYESLTADHAKFGAARESDEEYEALDPDHARFDARKVDEHTQSSDTVDRDKFDARNVDEQSPDTDVYVIHPFRVLMYTERMALTCAVLFCRNKLRLLHDRSSRNRHDSLHNCRRSLRPRNRRRAPLSAMPRAPHRSLLA